MKERSERRGFTLIEIVVSLTIIGILLVAVIPNIGPMRARAQLSAGARNVAATIRYARMEAIYRKRPVQVRIDTQSARYRLDLLSEGKPASERDEDEVEMVEAIRSLPETVWFEEVTLYGDGDVGRKGVVALTFSPRGTVSPAQIVLCNRKDQRLTLEVFAMTGAVEAYTGGPR